MADGKLSIHRVKRSASDDPSRAIQTLQMELQQIMKGRCPLRAPVQRPQGAGALRLSVPCPGGRHGPPACRGHGGGAVGALWLTQLKGCGELLTVSISLLELTPSITCLPSLTLWDTFTHSWHHLFSGWEACSDGGLWIAFSLQGEPVSLTHVCLLAYSSPQGGLGKLLTT